MAGLSPIEQECREVFLTLIDYMSPGRRKVANKDHMEIVGQMRNCVQKLTNKEYGCSSGLHAAACTCREGLPGKAIHG